MAIDPAATEADSRAAEAERSTVALFGHRLLELPGTHLGYVSYPPPPFVGGSWNYWWQAHYLDAIVDAGWRLGNGSDAAGALRHAKLGDRLLATIRLRNLGRVTNLLYDDMAWLALAAQRLRRLWDELGSPSAATTRRLSSAERSLTARLRSASTADLGGGVFWNTTRDFKNVPATGPTALHLARSGDLVAAGELVDWLYSRLWARDTGLFLDGIRITPAGEQAVTDIYTYNQGTVLGVLLAVGGSANLSKADNLVAAVATHLTVADGRRRPLVTHGGGDGGLFTGILVRYLAQAATHPGLDARARATAERLVRDTAEPLWRGRDDRTLADGRSVTLFSPDAARPAVQAQPRGAVVELSTQMQAWTILEAAAVVTRQRPAHPST